MDVLFGRGREHADQFIGAGGVAVLKRPVAVGFHPLAIDVVLINPGHGCGGHAVSSFASAIRPEVSEPTEVRSLRGTINLADGPAGVNEPAVQVLVQFEISGGVSPGSDLQYRRAAFVTPHDRLLLRSAKFSKLKFNLKELS